MSAPIESLRAGMANLTAPTPQNTPATLAPISLNKPNPMPSIGEVHEPQPMGEADVRKLIDTLNLNKSSHEEPLVDMSKFPPAVQDRLRGLKAIQKEHRQLEAEFQREVFRLEKEYFQKFCPLYTKRYEMIVGSLEPTSDEIEAGKDDEEENLPSIDKSTESPPSPGDIKGIPRFWLAVLKNRDAFAALITDRDEKALEKLTDIRLDYLETNGFRITFDFGRPDDNEFFSNQTLTKTYHYQKDLGYAGSFIYDRAEGDKILWKDGQDLTTKVEKRTQRNKSTRQTRTVSRTVPVDSFFRFFTVPTSTDLSGGEDGLDLETLEEMLEEDYQRGEDLKEKLIPHAIDWFTGKALQYEPGLDDLDYEDEDYLSDDIEDDEEDSEEDEEDGGKPKQEAAECKQS